MALKLKSCTFHLSFVFPRTYLTSNSTTLPLGGVVVTWCQWASGVTTKGSYQSMILLSLSFHFSFKNWSEQIRCNLPGAIVWYMIPGLKFLFERWNKRKSRALIENNGFHVFLCHLLVGQNPACFLISMNHCLSNQHFSLHSLKKLLEDKWSHVLQHDLGRTTGYKSDSSVFIKTLKVLGIVRASFFFLMN